MSKKNPPLAGPSVVLKMSIEVAPETAKKMQQLAVEEETTVEEVAAAWLDEMEALHRAGV